MNKNNNKTLTQLHILTVLTFTIIAVGTVFYHFVENLSWIDSIYFTVVTLTTVGYGDFSPVTNLGKLFTVGYILVGIGILAAFIAEYTHSIIEKRKK